MGPRLRRPAHISWAVLRAGATCWIRMVPSDPLRSGRDRFQCARILISCSSRYCFCAPDVLLWENICLRGTCREEMSVCVPAASPALGSQQGRGSSQGYSLGSQSPVPLT